MLYSAKLMMVILISFSFYHLALWLLQVGSNTDPSALKLQEIEGGNITITFKGRKTQDVIF
jgi:hypothetical protein